jgi:hypothetical protein
MYFLHLLLLCKLNSPNKGHFLLFLLLFFDFHLFYYLKILILV